MTLPVPCGSFMPSFFTPAHAELRHPHLLGSGAGRLYSPAASTVVLCWAFTAASPGPKLVSKEGQMQLSLLLRDRVDQQLSLGSGWDRTQDSHLHCTTVTPGSCQAAKGNRWQKGNHTKPQLRTYLRAEGCLLMEIAPHKFTILPGGYFTPEGDTSNQNEEQVTHGRHNGPSCALPGHTLPLVFSQICLRELIPSAAPDVL